MEASPPPHSLCSWGGTWKSVLAAECLSLPASAVTLSLKVQESCDPLAFLLLLLNLSRASHCLPYRDLGLS